MTTKPIKISEENYNWLLNVAGEMQKSEGRSISIDDALSSIKTDGKKGSGESLLRFAGSWKISDKETREFKKHLHEGWKRWKIQSV